ncbi:MAG: SpoIIIAH-like family protein [Clostridia bacterium]|nr:SpoIIIAH-like family protein [Clostridia bacterium]
MIKTLKKNQIIIFAIALMLITTGYISYTMKTEQVAETSAIAEQTEIAGIGDARLVSNDNVAISSENKNSNTANENKNSNTPNENSISNDTASEEVSVTSTGEIDTYFNQSKLDREKMYSEMLETYQNILANSEISAEQKNTAQGEINKINEQRNSIMIAENLIKNKGFQDVVIFVNNNSVSAVVRAESIETAEIAQIQSIIQRELNVGVENIHISNK